MVEGEECEVRTMTKNNEQMGFDMGFENPGRTSPYPADFDKRVRKGYCGECGMKPLAGNSVRFGSSRCAECAEKHAAERERARGAKKEAKAGR